MLNAFAWPQTIKQAHSGHPSFTVRTTRVSNPVRYPHLRASASIMLRHAAFAIGVLRDIYAFHRYTTNSAYLPHTQVSQFALHGPGWARTFHNTLLRRPTLPLNPINPDNARTFRITAAAGTELAGPYSYGTCKGPHVTRFIPAQKQFTTHRAVFLHATWLVQASAH